MTSDDTRIKLPSTVEERMKRTLIPPRWDLARITWRELRRGEPELKLLPFLLDRSRAAMDIGANRGIWARQMARCCRTVWAFEPNPKLFPILKAGLGPTISARAEALSDRDGETELLVPGKGNRFSNQTASLSTHRNGRLPHIRVPVRVARLDALEPPPTGFLKIDVEGHERAVIEGALGLIARDRPTLIIEIEQRQTGRPLDEDLDYVEGLGYRTFVLVKGRLCGREVLADDTAYRSSGEKPLGINNFIFIPKG